MNYENTDTERLNEVLRELRIASDQAGERAARVERTHEQLTQKNRKSLICRILVKMQSGQPKKVGA